MSKFDDIREEVRRLMTSNYQLNNWISSQEEAKDNQVGEICKDFLQVLEAFEWAEATIHERGLDQSKISTSAIARMLTAKTKLLEVLESHGVKKVEFADDVFDASKGKVVGTVANEKKPEGTVDHIQRDGFYRKDRLLRPAEVILVKN